MCLSRINPQFCGNLFGESPYNDFISVGWSVLIPNDLIFIVANTVELDDTMILQVLHTTRHRTLTVAMRYTFIQNRCSMICDLSQYIPIYLVNRYEKQQNHMNAKARAMQSVQVV